ncbi:MAG: hypothetical protein Q9210_001176 [Variospora velana]
MAEPLSTAAAVVSFVDVTIRACKGIRAVVDAWREAPNAIHRLRQIVQNQQSMLECLRLYAVEYESSKLFVEQHQLLPLVVKNELRGISSDLDLLQQLLPPAGGQRKIHRQPQWIFDEKKIFAVNSRLDSRQAAVMTGLQVMAHHMVDLASILIKYGGADVVAVHNAGRSPTFIAKIFGLDDEWWTASDLCGFDPEDVLHKDIERWKKRTRIGPGDSTADDTEDLISSNFGTPT